MLPEQLPHLCNITKSVPVQDDLGGDLEEQATFLADEKCWVQPASDREVSAFQRRNQDVTHKVYFQGDPGFRGPGYVITPRDGTANCPFAGATLEVKSKAEATAGLGVLYRVMCEEIQPR